MELNEVLTLIFGLAATAMAILLKAESDRRRALQQQVTEQKREAYSKFSGQINLLVGADGSGEVSQEKAEDVAKELAKLRSEIWQYGSDSVVVAYGIWNQATMQLMRDNENMLPSVVLMAEVIRRMRQDMGLTRKGHLKPLDILRMFINDIEGQYDVPAKRAAQIRRSLRRARWTVLRKSGAG